MNKLILVLSSIILSLCIGSIYSWSIFILPIQNLTGFSLLTIQIAFCLTIFILGTTTSFASKYIMRIKPYKAALLGSILFSIGMICTGLVLLHPNLILLYITYGLCLGIGVGIIYLIPIPLLLQEFPKHPALGSSISILAFGFGSAIFVPLANLFPSIINAFIYIGIFYGILMIIASLCLKNKKFIIATNDNNHFITPQQAIQTKEFYYIFLMIFINISVGLALISIASPLGNELSLDAALLVSIIGLCNGFGRPIWANIADSFGYIKVYKILFITQILCIALLVLNLHTLTTLFAIFCIASCYGAGFSCCPALVSFIFGKKYAGEIFGRVLFAWGLASISPFIIMYLYSILGSYYTAIILLSGLYFIGLYCSIKLKKLI